MVDEFRLAEKLLMNNLLLKYREHIFSFVHIGHSSLFCFSVLHLYGFYFIKQYRAADYEDTRIVPG